jgi:hypothetical protein
MGHAGLRRCHLGSARWRVGGLYDWGLLLAQAGRIAEGLVRLPLGPLPSPAVGGEGGGGDAEEGERSGFEDR